MTYNEIIQSVGKQISKSVYYYNSSNVRVDIAEDNIEEIKIKQNCTLIGTLMKCAEITLKDLIETTNKIYVEIEAKFGDETATKTYGPYYLYETNYNADTKTYEHICYDAFLKTMVEYKPIVTTYPTTVQSFYNTLITTLGLTSNVQLVNGSNTLESDIYSGTGYTYRSVIQDIAEANGILLYIDNLEVKTINLGNDSNKAIIDDDILKNTNIDFGETYGPINVLTISRAGDGDTIYYPENLPSNIREFKISDNIMLGENNRDQFIRNIYNKLNGVSYEIFDCELVGYGGFEPLQKVQFETGDNVYNSYVFNNEITFTSGYSEIVYTDLPEEVSGTNYSAADTTDNRIKQTYILVNKQTQEIKSVVTDELYDSSGNSKISQLTQTVDDLKTEIGKTADVTTLSEGTGTIFLENILSSEAIYLQVRPTATDINYKITNKCKVGTNVVITTPTMYIQQLDDSGNVVNEDTYSLPKPLYIYDTNTYDEFIIDYENQKKYIIHRVGINDDGTKYKLDTSYEETFEYDSFMFEESSDYNILFKGFSTAYIKVRAMVSNIYTSQYATRVELNSKINQTADSITAEVNEKVGKDEIVAKINLAVQNDQGIINLTGNSVTIDSDNFELDSEGNMTCQNATMNNATINKGNIIFEDDGKTSSTRIKIESTGQDITNKISSWGMSIESGAGTKTQCNLGAIYVSYGEYSTGVEYDRILVLKDGSGYRLNATNGLSQYSDIRLKENVKNIDNSLSKEIIKELNPIEFNYINSDRKHRGLIAQDVVKILNKNNISDEIYSYDDKERLMLSYEEFIPDLIGCNKYLINKVEELEKRIEELENEK